MQYIDLHKRNVVYQCLSDLIGDNKLKVAYPIILDCVSNVVPEAVLDFTLKSDEIKITINKDTLNLNINEIMKLHIALEVEDMNGIVRKTKPCIALIKNY